MASGRNALHPVKLKDPDAHKAVGKIREAVQDLQKHPLMASREIGPITLTNGSITRIAHGLGRELKRWERIRLVVDETVSDSGTVFEIQKGVGGSGVDDKKELWLKAVGFGGEHPTIWIRVY